MVLVGVACSGGTATPTAPSSPAASARPAAEQTYLSVLDKNWQSYADGYAKPPCSKWDSAGLPVELAACRQGTVDLARVTQTFLDDLGQVSVPPRMATQDGYLRNALKRTLTATKSALQALDGKDGPGFAPLAQEIADSYTAATAARRELMKP